MFTMITITAYECIGPKLKKEDIIFSLVCKATPRMRVFAMVTTTMKILNS